MCVWYQAEAPSPQKPCVFYISLPGLQLRTPGLALYQNMIPEGSKVPNYRVFRVSISGIVFMVLGRYFIVGYLDP